MPLDVAPEDREMLVRYASRPHRLPAHTKAKALLAAAQGMSEEQIALSHSIAIHEVAQLIIQYRLGGLAALGLSGSGSSEGRSRRRARLELIVKTPGICGGAARINGTRIPVWQLVEERNLGASEAQLLNDYRSLKARDLTAAWDYADEHSAEIAAEIRRNAGA